MISFANLPFLVFLKSKDYDAQLSVGRLDLKPGISSVSSGSDLIGLYVTKAVFSKEGNGLVAVILS